MVHVVQRVDSDRSHVFDVLTDFEHYPEWVPACEKVVVKNRAGNVTDLEMTLNYPARLQMSHRFECEPEVLVSFTMTGGSKVKSYRGSYRLANCGASNATVLVSEIEFDAGGIIPQFMVDRKVQESLKNSGSALQRVCKQFPRNRRLS